MALMEAQTCGKCSFQLIYGHVCANVFGFVKPFYFIYLFTSLTLFLLQNVDMDTDSRSKQSLH